MRSLFFPHLEKWESDLPPFFFFFKDLYTVETAVLHVCNRASNWSVGHVPSFILLYFPMFLMSPQKMTANNSETSFASSLWILLSGTPAFTHQNYKRQWSNEVRPAKYKSLNIQAHPLTPAHFRIQSKGWREISEQKGLLLEVGENEAGFAFNETSELLLLEV